MESPTAARAEMGFSERTKNVSEKRNNAIGTSKAPDPKPMVSPTEQACVTKAELGETSERTMATDRTAHVTPAMSLRAVPPTTRSSDFGFDAVLDWRAPFFFFAAFWVRLLGI
jgi:hypothetical protein